MEDLALVLTQAPHQPTGECDCTDCESLRDQIGCENPHSCMLWAEKLLAPLPEKWDPQSELPEDYQLKPKQDDFPEGSPWDEIDVRVTTRGTLAEIFRIFADPKCLPTNFLPDLKFTEANEIRATAATDGSCIDNGKENARAGAGIFFGEYNQDNQAIRIPPQLTQSNQTGDLVAVKIATETADKARGL
ncbi:hypothetical protein BDP27DRAFT_1487656, partial [Rhodocollybia butyracea]